MEFMLDIPLPRPDQFIAYDQKIISIGSCFTEHIGNALMDLKFDVVQNPNGILFDPASVCYSLVSYIQNKQYSEKDLFYLNEVWQSWQHHSRFSSVDKNAVLKQVNESQEAAHNFLKQADWLIITLGSSFSYRLVNENLQTVANCHRAPASWFQKYLMPITETIERLDNTIHQLFYFNPKIKIIFTISPVRHIRDGVVENNRSKARLIEAVHHLVNKFDRLYYFPSYEMVIDVLRDYRFYDIDMVHPNYSATDFVLRKFLEVFMTDETNQLIQEIKKLVISRKHKPTHPTTEAHKKFLNANLEKAKSLQEKYPFLDFKKEMDYFSSFSKA